MSHVMREVLYVLKYMEFLDFGEIFRGAERATYNNNFPFDFIHCLKFISDSRSIYRNTHFVLLLTNFFVTF